MTEAKWYSVGVDLSQIPWQIAIVDADGTESLAGGHTHGPTSGELSSAQGDVEGIAAAIRQVAAERGAMPAAIALCVSTNHASTALTDEVAHGLGMDASAVRLLPAIATPDRKATDLVVAGALALGAARSAAVVGHVATAGAVPVALAGPAGVSLGSGAVGPAGVSFSAAAAVGSAGVPLGTVGANGPTGVPLGVGQGIGPTGQPLIGNGTGSGGSGDADSGGLASKLLRLPVVVAAVVALIVVTVVVVVASHDDTPSSVPPLSPSSVVTVSAGVDATTAPTTAVVTTLTPTSVKVVATISPAACAVGSWVADNDDYLAAMQAAALGAGVTWDAVTGSLRLDISADGAVATTYEEWTLTSTLGGAGSALTSVVGVDSNTVTFADDGTYAVTATEIASQTKVSSGGFSILDGPSQDSLLRGSATFTCDGNRLEISHHAATDFGAADLVMVFARSD